MNWRAFLVTFLLSSVVMAQTTPVPYTLPVPQLTLEPIPSGNDIIISLPKGEKAPFDGQLFEGATALRWGNYLEQYRVRLQSCYQQQVQLSAIDQQYLTQVLKIEQDSNLRIVSDLELRLRNVESRNAELQGELSKGPPWYNSLGFGVVLGVGGTLVLAGLTAWVLSSVK